MNEQPADRVLVNLTSAQVHAIDQLRALGYGDDKATPASVIEYIVARFIDDMKRARVLSPPPSED